MPDDTHTQTTKENQKSMGPLNQRILDYLLATTSHTGKMCAPRLVARGCCRLLAVTMKSIAKAPFMEA